MNATAVLTEAATRKRAEADRIADGTDSGDRAASRLTAPGLAQHGRRTDTTLRRHAEAVAAAGRLDDRARLAAARENEAPARPDPRSQAGGGMTAPDVTTTHLRPSTQPEVKAATNGAT